ncbi:MAG: selenide, water dikinase SelD [Ginsengibacter sp.]
MEIKLTGYSHGAGCGCKISPQVLDRILKSNFSRPDNKNLLVGNSSKDDAAVYDLGNGTALISTTDFFMPIVDDPFEFGKIASANAISDVYAMGGRPVLAIAILGWPINVLPAEVAQLVIEGARSTCDEAGISLAGGHSIDSPEPIFGLAVNGLVKISSIKQNNTAKACDVLYLTKKLGVGILTTAEKKGILSAEDKALAADQMKKLNKIGEQVGNMSLVHAVTDVTGFGLLGHLTEMCEGSHLSAELFYNSIPLLTKNLKNYISQKSVPGGTNRNWESYGEKIFIDNKLDKEEVKALLADPQTSGGLLISVAKEGQQELEELFKLNELEEFLQPIGRMKEQTLKQITVLNT